ncbi:MAG TPA: pitrilysin family protein [Methanomassiliicoccales archaeon]|nr:pitrilysin family protein [Methanomassiliicoccales archaeon]
MNPRGLLVNVNKQQLSISYTPAGVPVIVEVLPHTRSVAASICVGTGSRDEGPSLNGISHFLEHMLFRGTTTRTYKEVNEAIEDAGGYLNAFTTHELTAYYCLTMDETSATGLTLLEDIFIHPRMAKEHVDLERGVIKQELNSMLNEPDIYIRRLMSRSHFGDHPLAWPVLGSEQTLDAFQPEDLLRYHDDHYSPPNLAVVVAGNVRPDEIMVWAEASLDHLVPDGKARERTVPPVLHEVEVYPRNGEHTYVGLGLPGLAAPDERTAVQDVVCTILSGGASSRFNHRIREEEGLVYSIHTNPVTYVDCGTVDTYFSTTSQRAERVLELFAEEIRKLKTDGLRPGELDRAKRVIKGAILRSLGQPRDDLRLMIFTFMGAGKVRTMDEIIRRVEAVTEEQIMAYVEQHLRRKKMCGAIHAAEELARSVAAKASEIDF